MNNSCKYMLVFTSIIIFSGCSGSSDRTEITETADRSEFRSEDPVNATSDERFRTPAQPDSPHADTDLASTASTSEKPFHYTVPEGWNELPPTQFRNLNFAIGQDDDMECYVTILNGDGGGVLLNANRWRTQFNVEPYTEEEFNNLQIIPIMGFPSKALNFVGDFKGVGDTDVKTDYRLIGAIIKTPDSLITVKMTGPNEKLVKELNQFATFLGSLHLNDGGHTHDDQQAAASPSESPSASTSTLPAPDSAGDFKWEVPEGWSKSDTGSAMRLITFSVGGMPGQEAECYIVMLGGDGGGRLNNYNRWLGQFGLDPLLQSEIALQPPVMLFDNEAPMLVCEGSFTGMGNTPKENYMLVGASCTLENESMFIKMVGPTETVTNNLTKFIIFCSTIEVKS